MRFIREELKEELREELREETRKRVREEKMREEERGEGGNKKQKGNVIIMYREFERTFPYSAVCWFYMGQYGCRRGEGCPYVHDSR